MNVIKKALWVVACIAVFNISFGILAAVKFTSLMGVNGGADYTLQNKNDGAYLDPVEFDKSIIDVSYIKNDGKMDNRPVILYTPQNLDAPFPVIYIPHYAVEENSADFRMYLAKGWAVASPTDFKNEYNGELTENDLVFNNAALYALRHSDFVDDRRIAVVGGSAGGYTALMLGELQMGTCVTVANSPIANAYFNFYVHFQNCDKANREAGAFDFPIIVQGMVSKMFRPNLDNFEEEDYEKWAKLSPVGNVRCISSPTVVNHFTADMLVPIDQISKKYTYDDSDERLPDWFSTRMSDDFPGILSCSLEEEADSKELSLLKIDIENNRLDMAVPYSEKLLSINIFDDGAVHAGNGHASPNISGNCNVVPFIEEMFSRTLAKTEKLTTEKLLMMLERYCGNSVQLPAHKDADDNVYGSLAFYQREIVEELSAYAENHSLEELASAVNAALADCEDRNPAAAWNEIKGGIRYNML